VKIWQKLFIEAPAFNRDEFGLHRDEFGEEVLFVNEKQTKILHKGGLKILTGV